MNPNFPDPDSWIDVIDHALVAIFMLLVAVIPTWITVRSSRGIKDIKNQVVNGHTATNLREDLDRAIGAIERLAGDVTSFRRQITEDVGHLRRELTDEQERRLRSVAEVRADADRRFTDLHRRIGGEK